MRHGPPRGDGCSGQRRSAIQGGWVMSTTPFEVYLPCEVLAVNVQVGPQEHLSPLEKAIP